jgi:uncharacterized delta-60 repeat protein
MRLIVPLAALFIANSAFAQPTWMDITFGDHGVVITPLSDGPYDRGYGVAIQPDGKTLVTGSRANGQNSTRAFVLRYDESGALDNSFSGNGIVTVTNGQESLGRTVMLLPDGGVVAGGHILFGATFNDLMLAKFDAAGTPDPAFSGDGVFYVSHASAIDEIYSLARRSDDVILACGSLTGTSSDVLAMAVNPDGTTHNSFADGGEYVSSYNTGEISVELLLRNDGRMALVGATDLDQAHGDLAVFQLMPDGTLDPSFGVNGRFRSNDTNYVDYARCAALMDDGRIVIGGGKYWPGGSEQLYITRVTADGALDDTFGQNGFLPIPVDLAHEGTLDDILITADQKIVTACVIRDTSGLSNELLFVRTDMNGDPDLSFGTNGFLSIPCPGSPTCWINAIAGWPDGRITATGFIGNLDTTDVMTIRLLPEMSDGIAEGTATSHPLRVWPNPANGSFQVTIPDAISATRLELCDALGRVVSQWPLTGSGERTVMIEPEAGLHDACYVLKAIGTRGTAVQRMLLH